MCGRPPRFELGRFELVADFVSRRAAISYGKELLNKDVPLSVEAVVKAYQREAKAIVGRNEDPDRWMAHTTAAGRTPAATHAASRRQARVNIVDCYFEMVLLRQAEAFRSAPSKRTFVDYSRAQFAHDLSSPTGTPLHTRACKSRAHVATKSQADNADKSLWLVEGSGPHDGSYIADVEFDRDQ